MRSPPPNPQNEQDNSRLLMAILVSMVILFGFHFLYEKPQQERLLRQQQALQAQKTVTATAPVVEQQMIKSRPEVLGAAKRIPIRGSKVTGSLSLTGARIDDLALNEHYATIENKEHVALLSPSGARDAYYVESGWMSSDGYA